MHKIDIINNLENILKLIDEEESNVVSYFQNDDRYHRTVVEKRKITSEIKYPLSRACEFIVEAIEAMEKV